MNGKPNARVLQNNFYSWKIPVVPHQSQKETHSQLDLWYTFNFLRWSSTILQRYIKPIIIIIHQTSLLLKFIINKQTSSFTSFRTVQYSLIQCCTTYYSVCTATTKHPWIVLFVVCMYENVCSSVDILLLHLLAII